MIQLLFFTDSDIRYHFGNSFTLAFFVNSYQLQSLFVRSYQSTTIFCDIIFKSSKEIAFFWRLSLETLLAALIRLWKNLIHLFKCYFLLLEKNVVYFSLPKCSESSISKEISLWKEILENVLEEKSWLHVYGSVEKLRTLASIRFEGTAVELWTYENRLKY